MHVEIIYEDTVGIDRNNELTLTIQHDLYSSFRSVKHLMKIHTIKFNRQSKDKSLIDNRKKKKLKSPTNSVFQCLTLHTQNWV